MMSRLREMARDERGMTLVEMMVATAAGVVVTLGITTAMLVSMRQVQRVSAHVEANRQARLAMSDIVDQLHSACLSYDFAPVREDSTGTTLNFVHKSGSSAALTPVLSKIALSGTTLVQSDYAYSSGTAPEWKFATSPSQTTQLMTGVSPTSTGAPIFRYYGYSAGSISGTPLSSSPTLSTRAAETVQVNIAFKVTPSRSVRDDPNGATTIQNSALLRTSPADFETSSPNRPCL